MMEQFLEASEIIDWQHEAVLKQAHKLSEGLESKVEIARRCFEWVRDEIKHSFDYQMNPVTCKASDVLHYKTGYCYAKSHLLSALLRANEIPAGLCYQRLSVDEKGAPYCLHGFNGIYLEEYGWYRIDPRGNKPSINTQFEPPGESLAFQLLFPDEEATFDGILPAPLPEVVEALNQYKTWDTVLENLPDISWQQAEKYGLSRR